MRAFEVAGLVSVEARLDEAWATLKRRAQTALAVGKGRRCDSSARPLDEEQTLKKAKLETGTSLILQVGKVRVVCKSSAFSAILGDGSVVPWGSSASGGNSRAVQDQLKGVQQIQASSRALQQSWPMGQLLPGAAQRLVATVVLCKIS